MAKWSTRRNRVRMLAALLGAMLGVVAAGDARAGAWIDDAQVMAALPANAILEVRLDADIDGDGLSDVAALGGTGDERRVVVWFGAATGYLPPLSAPLGAPNSNTGAALDHDKGDLLVYDATGSDAETKTIYRFRREPGASAAWLVSLEIERYHGQHATRLAWNLLTGAHEFARGNLVESTDGEEAMPRYPDPRRTQRASPPVAMAQAPLPDALIEAEARKPARRD